jgi:hypothetical protein
MIRPHEGPEPLLCAKGLRAKAAQASSTMRATQAEKERHKSRKKPVTSISRYLTDFPTSPTKIRRGKRAAVFSSLTLLGRSVGQVGRGQLGSAAT